MVVGLHTDFMGSVGPYIETECLALNAFTRDHALDPRYGRWLRDREVLLTLNLPSYLERRVSDAELIQYADQMIADADVWFYALEVLPVREFVGTVKARFNRQAVRADLGIMLGEKRYWRRGLATSALSALAWHLITEVGVCKLTAGAMATNLAMLRVFEKLGFQREGVFRQHDVVEGQLVDHIHLGCLADELRSIGGRPGGL